MSASGAVAGATVNYYVFDFRSNTKLADFNVVTSPDGVFSATVSMARLHLNVSPPAGSKLLGAGIPNIDVSRDISVTIPLDVGVRLTGRAVAPAGTKSGATIEYQSLSQRYSFSRSSPDGSFSFDVPADRYAIHVTSDDPTLQPARASVDVRNGDVLGLTIPLSSEPASFVPAEPPIASRISVSAADPAGLATVSGLPGAVAANATVQVANLQSGQVSYVVSEPDGSFTTPMFAPPGSFIQIKHDVAGRYLVHRFPFMDVPPGTILYVPAESEQIVAVGRLRNSIIFDVTRARFFGGPDAGQWFLSAPFNSNQWGTGQPISLAGDLTVTSKDFKDFDVTNLRISGSLNAQQIFDGEGRHLQARETFMSNSLTPTGLPIINLTSAPSRIVGSLTVDSVMRVSSDMLRAKWRLAGNFSPSLGEGYYRLAFSMTVVGLPPATDHSSGVFPIGETIRGVNPETPSRIVRIGNPRPPRMLWMLAVNDLVDGQRGVVANEDRKQFAFGTAVITQTATSVLPMNDARSGRGKTYSFEPFAPFLSNANGGLPFDGPQIPLLFPSGELSIRVVRPDGVTEELGSAPFVQNRIGSPHSKRGLSISGRDNTTARISDFLQLTTLQRRFDYSFTRYGTHRVIVSGHLSDVWGHRYEAAGTYEIEVAQPLDIETAIVPGTPFEVGNQMAQALIVRPPVPAQITRTTTLLPNSDLSRAITSVTTGHANRFGFFSAPAVSMSAPGEYRVDITARYTDARGQVWVGSVAWGTVVETPGSQIIAHGKRGFENASQQTGAWFFVRNALDRGNNHLMYPFFSGDVMWMQKDDTLADSPASSVEDRDGSFAARIKTFGVYRNQNSERLEAQIRAGEIPLRSDCFDEGCMRAYSYLFAERPGVHVREVIQEESTGFTYWRFQDHYQLQLGTGANSDLPNDFKFQFGGTVFRDQRSSFQHYGAYGSLWVLLPNADAMGGRVMPPFQGNGNGPSGGPLFKLKGRDIDLFFHPTAVRPGSVLHSGNVVSLAGYSAPPLPSKVEIIITAPSGVQRTIRGQANKIGYFHDASQDFVAHETGVWKARTRIVFDGVTSAGQVTTPFPAGDVLGSRDGEYYFYVVRGDTEALQIEPMPRFVRPADGPITFRVSAPVGLANAQMTFTTTMPGFILEEGTTNSLTYTYDAQRLANDFPNLDLYDDDGLAGVDAVTITFLASGDDSTGARRHFARQVVIQGEELQMPEQKPSPPRRRTVRR